MLSCVALGLPAFAQAYPTKPVKLLVGATAGGPADFLARLFAEVAAESTGQSFIVENRPGASGTLAAEVVAKSTPDGHTLLVAGSASIVVAPQLFQKLAFDPAKDLVPVAMIGVGPFILAVHPSVPAQSVEQLIALARKRPGTLAYGSGGTGSTSHLSAELFASMVGVRLLHAPYKGEAAAVNDLVGGQIQFAFAAPNAVLPHLQAGRLRALAVTSRERQPALPTVPTMQEAGIANYESLGWIGLFAPFGTPRNVIDTLSGAWNADRARGSTSARLQPLGMTAPERFRSPEALGDYVREEVARTTRLIRDVGLTLN